MVSLESVCANGRDALGFGFVLGHKIKGKSNQSFIGKT